VNEGVDAAIFYVSVAALAIGMVRSLRASIERQVRDRIGMLLAGAGVAGLIIAVIAFVTGPRTVLPF